MLGGAAGFDERNIAAAPETYGAATEVPDTSTNPPIPIEELTFPPGANISTQLPKFDSPHMSSSVGLLRTLAATEITPLALAGEYMQASSL